MLCRKAAMHFPLYSEAARGQRVAQANHSVISCVMLDCNSELLKPFCFVMLWPLFQSLARRLPMPGVVNRTFENRTQSNSIELNPWIEFD